LSGRKIPSSVDLLIYVLISPYHHDRLEAAMLALHRMPLRILSRERAKA
jgi:hypothetical protein